MIGSGMTRRRFAQSIGGFGLLTAPYFAAPAAKGQIYVVQNYLSKNGTQLARWHRFMEQCVVSELKTLAARKSIYLEAMIAPHTPQAMTIMEFESFDHWRSVRSALASPAACRKDFSEWAAADEPPFESYSECLLAATDFNPGLSGDLNGPARIFEYRIYHSPAYRQLQLLNERFAGPAIFCRTGLKPTLYANALTGNDLPNLAYLRPFETLAARERAWAAFSVDPEWLKLRANSIEQYGEISSVMHISLWRPAAYSPVK